MQVKALVRNVMLVSLALVAVTSSDLGRAAPAPALSDRQPVALGGDVVVSDLSGDDQGALHWHWGVYGHCRWTRWGRLIGCPR